MQLQRMVLFGPELSEADHEVLSLAELGRQKKVSGVFGVAGRIDLRCLLRLSPKPLNMVVGPRAISRNLVSKKAATHVIPDQQPVINALAFLFHIAIRDFV